jgi:hypothetical protein
LGFSNQPFQGVKLVKTAGFLRYSNSLGIFLQVQHSDYPKNPRFYMVLCHWGHLESAGFSNQFKDPLMDLSLVCRFIGHGGISVASSPDCDNRIGIQMNANGAIQG